MGESDVVKISTKAWNKITKSKPSYPKVHMLGINKKGIIEDAFTLVKGYMGCDQMPNITGESLAKGLSQVYKNKLIPCGISRSGRDIYEDPDNGDRGDSWYQLTEMNPEVIVITVYEDGIYAERLVNRIKKVLNCVVVP
jgi:hypothetical protein